MIMSVNGPGDETGRSHEKILKRAYERFEAANEWQGTEDQRAREDIKFANGDARNSWQWPDKMYQNLSGGDQELPCLTINNTRVHNDLIINELSKNNYGIKIRPTGGKASYKSAQAMMNVVRRIEYVSKASSHYRKISEHQVDGGIGYALIETAYVSERSFDQDIYIRSAVDPTGVFLDPWIKEPDGSDAGWGFIFERMSRKRFNVKYPDYANKVGQAPLDSFFVSWLSDKEIVLAKYYEKEEIEDTLVSFKEGDTVAEKLASEIKDESGQEIYDALMAQIKDGTLDGKSRSVKRGNVRWYLIAGNKVVDEGDWAGKYIPICRCPGREIVVDGKLDRKGHTRPLINAQQMLNYNASVAVQVGALQPKATFIAPARSVEGQEQFKTMNIDNFPVVLYNDIDDEAPPELQRIDPPTRLDPPKVSPVNLQGMQDAERQMMMISGQFQAQMGENDTQSAASGKAINERKEQGDTATYHFPEHKGDMLRFIGMQLIDLIPKIYDTERLLHIEDEAGEKQWIKIDPNMQDAIQEFETKKEDEEAVRLAFNPSIGEYECVSDPGPDYATQRQEAWQAYSMILQQNMQLAATIGDLIFRYGDFPGSDKIADRLEKEIKATKPYLFDEKAEPQLVALQQQMQRLTALNAELMQKLSLKEIALKGKDERRDIEAFNAETNRLKMTVEALAKLMLTPQQREQMEHEIALRSHDATMQMIVDANAAELQPEPAAGAAQ